MERTKLWLNFDKVLQSGTFLQGCAEVLACLFAFLDHIQESETIRKEQFASLIDSFVFVNAAPSLRSLSDSFDRRCSLSCWDGEEWPSLKSLFFLKLQLTNSGVRSKPVKTINFHAITWKVKTEIYKWKQRKISETAPLFNQSFYAYHQIHLLYWTWLRHK